jgi:ornithine cyclodeaminase
MIGVPYLDGGRLLALLTPGEALRAVRRFFREHDRAQVAAPPRIHLNVPGRDNIGLYMPAATRRFIGVKLAHLMPRRRPNVEAEVFLYEAATGRLLYWGDGKPLTALRTAAVSAAGALAVLPRCRALAVFGSGVQAAAHIAAFAGAYPMLEDVRVRARSPAAGERLRALLPAGLAPLLRLEESPRAALSGADAIVTATPAPAPLFDAAWLPESCHIAAIGSAAPGMNELPPGAFTGARVWLDSPAALREAGDCLAAARAGWEPARVMGDQFDLIGGPAPAPGGRTLFKTVGHAAQDLALLIRVWELNGGAAASGPAASAAPAPR